MLTRIGKAAVGRASAHGSLSGIRRVGGFASQLQRVCVTRKAAAASEAYPIRIIVASNRSYATTTKAAAPSKAKKSPAKKSTKPKTKAIAKKPAKKVRRSTKALTAEEKQKRADAKTRLRIKELKSIALLSEPKALPNTAWTILFSEYMAQRKGAKTTDAKSVTSLALEAAASYKNLSASEREQLNHRANQNKEANAITYKKWVETYTPEQIRLANNARYALKRRAAKSMVEKTKFSPISDSRQIKRPLQPYLQFVQERFKSGDFQGITLKDAGGRLGSEWKALSSSEKQPYIETANAELSRYTADYKTLYNHDPPAAKPAKTVS